VSRVRTLSGSLFDVVNPRAEAIRIDDIAASLAKLCRFNGHCRPFYSVADHSIRVSEACEERDALWGLLHDASEAYLGDMVSPIKQLGELAQYRELHFRVQSAVLARFGLGWPQPASVGHTDLEAAATEMRDLTGGDRSHLPEPWPDTIHPRGIAEAEVAFLDRFAKLTGGL
jgi:hypothetical protein